MSSTMLTFECISRVTAVGTLSVWQVFAGSWWAIVSPSQLPVSNCLRGSSTNFLECDKFL